MEDLEQLSLEQMRAFLEASAEVHFQAKNRQDLYSWVSRILGVQDYRALKREDKGLVRRFLAKLTGRSRAQIARLIHCYREGREVQPESIGGIVFQFAIPGWISNNWPA